MTNPKAKQRKDRRHSARWTSHKPIRWRTRYGHRIHPGYVLERSLNGMVINTHAEHSPGVGTCLTPSDNRMGLRHGFRSAIVRRVTDIDQDHQQLFVEILA